jgi:hypothetical protein
MSEAAIEALAQGRHGDPFALLGPQREGGQWVVRAIPTGGAAVTALGPSGETLVAFRRVRGVALRPAHRALRHRRTNQWRKLPRLCRADSPPVLASGDIVVMDNLGSHKGRAPFAPPSAPPKPRSSSCLPSRRTSIRLNRPSQK